MPRRAKIVDDKLFNYDDDKPKGWKISERLLERSKQVDSADIAIKKGTFAGKSIRAFFGSKPER